jgi:hypothetical protein
MYTTLCDGAENATTSVPRQRPVDGLPPALAKVLILAEAKSFSNVMAARISGSGTRCLNDSAVVAARVGMALPRPKIRFISAERE